MAPPPPNPFRGTSDNGNGYWKEVNTPAIKDREQTELEIRVQNLEDQLQLRDTDGATFSLYAIAGALGTGVVEWGTKFLKVAPHPLLKGIGYVGGAGLGAGAAAIIRKEILTGNSSDEIRGGPEPWVTPGGAYEVIKLNGKTYKPGDAGYIDRWVEYGEHKRGEGDNTTTTTIAGREIKITTPAAIREIEVKLEKGLASNEGAIATPLPAVTRLGAEAPPKGRPQKEAAARYEFEQDDGNGGVTLRATNRDDIATGSDRGDVIYGNRGDDTLSGRSGNDKIYGGSGNDILKGGNGNDELWGGSGADTFYGGKGADLFGVAKGEDVIEDFEADFAKIWNPYFKVAQPKEHDSVKGFDIRNIEDFHFTKKKKTEATTSIWSKMTTATSSKANSARRRITLGPILTPLRTGSSK